MSVARFVSLIGSISSQDLLHFCYNSFLHLLNFMLRFTSSGASLCPKSLNSLNEAYNYIKNIKALRLRELRKTLFFFRKNPFGFKTRLNLFFLNLRLIIMDLLYVAASMFRMRKFSCNEINFAF